MKLKAYAKINLTLDAVGVRKDGYHLLRMIMQSVSLYDEVVLHANRGGIVLQTNDATLPTDEKNIAYAAAARFFAAAGIAPAVDLYIEKRIPAAAGLGGGSADAAAVLLGLNRLHGFVLDADALAALALTLGADVPFFLRGGTALAEGIGERLTPLAPMPSCALVLIKPCDKPSTGAMYAALDALAQPLHPDTDGAIAALRAGEMQTLCRTLGNAFAPIWAGTATDGAQADLMRQGALGTGLSGSGPTVFGVFADVCAAQRAADALSDSYSQIFVAQPTPCGVEMVD